MSIPMFRTPKSPAWHVWIHGFWWHAAALCKYAYNGYNRGDPEYRMDGMPADDWCKNCLRIWRKEKGESDE